VIAGVQSIKRTAKEVALCAAALLCCRFVEREYDSSRDIFSVAAVDEEHRIETAAGDMLFLKGQAYPGMYGKHSVRRFPSTFALSAAAGMASSPWQDVQSGHLTNCFTVTYWKCPTVVQDECCDG
jgi:hypothetical protein